MDLEAIQAGIVVLRPMLREASRQSLLVQCLFELQDLTDGEFDKWLEFLRSEAGGKYARAESAAFRDALLARAEIFTRVLLEVARRIKVRNEA
jgi:hypothetical protein